MAQPEDFRAPLYEVKANLFKGLAHPVRVRILERLSEAPEVSVPALLSATGLEASHLSQHLLVLRRYHLVVSERRGQQMFYALAHPQIRELLFVSRELLQGILHTTWNQPTHSPWSPSGNPEPPALPE